jgi:hypothetical protein
MALVKPLHTTAILSNLSMVKTFSQYPFPISRKIWSRDHAPTKKRMLETRPSTCTTLMKFVFVKMEKAISMLESEFHFNPILNSTRFQILLVLKIVGFVWKLERVISLFCQLEFTIDTPQ